MRDPAANDRRIEALLLHREIEAFNTAYAAALDEQRLDDWAEMFTDDGFYVVSSRENADSLFFKNAPSPAFSRPNCCNRSAQTCSVR